MAAMKADTYDAYKEDVAEIKRCLKTLEWMLRTLIVESCIFLTLLTVVAIRLFFF